MPSFNEGNLRFEFGSAWSVTKYDEHPFYRKHVEKLKGPVLATELKTGVETEIEIGTLAVDFIGIAEKETYFFEIKDFRGYRIANKRRMRSGELAHEVARKVRDSIAGSIGAARNATTPGVLTEVARNLASNRPLFVVLWLEDDLVRDERIWKQELDTLRSEIQRRIRWLTAKVLVLSLATHAGRLPQLNVANTVRSPSL